MASPTRFYSGVATVPASQPLGNYPFPDPFHTSGSTGLDVVSYSNDFFAIGSTTLDWTVTGTSSTFATTDGLGGVSLVTPGGTTTTTTVAMAHSGFQFVAGQKFWYLCRIKASAVSSTKASSTSVNLVSTVNSTATTLVTGVTTAAADTYLDVGFYYDGTDILVYAADAVVARVSAPTVGASGTTLTNALLNVAFNVVPTATDTLSIDYVLAAQEAVR
jgi:hypothetical protein